MLTYNDSLLSKKVSMIGTILKETEIIEYNEAIANKEMTQKDDKMKL